MNGRKFDIKIGGIQYDIVLTLEYLSGSYRPLFRVELTVNGELVDTDAVKWWYYHWIHSFERDGHVFTLVAQMPRSAYPSSVEKCKIDCYVDDVSQTDGSHLDVLCECVRKTHWWSMEADDWRHTSRKEKMHTCVCVALIAIVLAGVQFLIRWGRGDVIKNILSDLFLFWFIGVPLGYIAISLGNHRGKKRELLKLLENCKCTKKSNSASSKMS